MAQETTEFRINQGKYKLAESGVWPDIDGTSICHAQAEEIRETGAEEGRIFQYAGLGDWRDVALRVLRNIGWGPRCVYEDTIYPQRMGSNTIGRSKICCDEGRN